RRNQTESFEAWSRYSQGLDARDRGDDARARALFQQALAADPAYKQAKSALEKVHVLVAREEARMDDEWTTKRKALSHASTSFGQGVFNLLWMTWGANGECGSASINMKRRIELLTWIASHDYAPATQPNNGHPEIAGMLSTFGLSLYDPEIVEELPA